MITYDDATLARFAKGEVDEIDALELYLDSGTVALCPGIIGSFVWNDITYVGVHGLLTLTVPDSVTGNDSQPITVTLAETYVPPDSDVPVNVFDDGIRASIDEEPWQGRVAILAVFLLDENGTIIEREQVDVMQIDGMTESMDESGRPMRVATLERPDIIQRDVEGKTADAAFQAIIDPDDLAMSHAGDTVTQDVYFGQTPVQPAAS